MRLNIQHKTQYVYSEPVAYTIQHLRLWPINGLGQHVKAWNININGGHMHRFFDTYGNVTHTLVIDEPHQELLISVSGEVETGVGGLIPTQSLPMGIFLRDTHLTQANTAMREFASQFDEDSLEAMMAALREKMHYLSGVTKVDTTAAQAFELGKGVCQDHAHAFIGCCRSIGIPARYVSGYLFTEDGSLMQTHAWVEVWQHHHWIGLDVSNGIKVGEMHVRVAIGLDYRSASPVTGTRNGGGAEGMSTSVMVNQNQELTMLEQQAQSQSLFQQAALIVQQQQQQ